MMLDFFVIIIFIIIIISPFWYDTTLKQEKDKKEKEYWDKKILFHEQNDYALTHTAEEYRDKYGEDWLDSPTP